MRMKSGRQEIVKIRKRKTNKFGNMLVKEERKKIKINVIMLKGNKR